MPMYDRKGINCEHLMVDCWEPVTCDPVPCRECGGPTERTWFTKPANVVSDECDVWIKHAICNADGSPRRYTSKAEIARAAKQAGYVSHVEHLSGKGGDRSKHTSRWV